MHVLTVSEFTTIAVGGHTSNNSAGPAISPAQHAALDRYNRDFKKRHKIAPLELGLRGVRTKQYVGVVSMGKAGLEVLPKFDVNAVAPTAERQRHDRTNLLRMLAATRKLPIRDAEARELGAQQFDLLEVIQRLFCEQLFKQVHRGLVHNYQSQHENLFRVRGKIMVTEQIKRNAVHRERTYCEFDEFSPDNPVNRILKAAVCAVGELTRVAETRRIARELRFALDQVSDRTISPIDFSRLPLDRTLSRYGLLLELAEAILLGPYPDVLSGSRNQVSLLFDMASLFEEYIGRQVASFAAELGMVVRLQGPRYGLATDELGSERFQLRPDISLSPQGDKASIKLLLDTKWKHLDSSDSTLGVAQADVYQMLAYAHRYKCSRVGLLYPFATSTTSAALQKWFKVDDVRIDVVGLDLRDLDSAKRALEDYLRHAISSLGRL